jgi:hypothetical protein
VCPDGSTVAPKTLVTGIQDRALQIGRVPGAALVMSTGPRQAHLHGFDLHANVAVAANNRDGLEQLARYVLLRVRWLSKGGGGCAR